jgi:hypothetical protein
MADGKVTGLNAFAIPSNCVLDLKKAAQVARDKYIEMIKSRYFRKRDMSMEADLR